MSLGSAITDPVLRNFVPLLKETWASWSAHKAPRMGAALSYYTAFSLAPLVVLIVGIVGLVVQHEAARRELVAQFSMLMGKSGADMVDAILTHSAAQSSGWFATVIGFFVLLLGASGVFGELQDSLNQIWEVPPRQTSWRWLVRDRLVSFSMVFALGFLVLVSLVLSAAIALVGAYFKPWLPGSDFLLELANSSISFVVITMMFAAMFRVLPDVRILWRDVWTGAAITAFLFVVGKSLLGFYIGRSAFSSTYGAAGSLVIVLFWVFYSAQIFFLGAEFTHAVAKRRGRA